MTAQYDSLLKSSHGAEEKKKKILRQMLKCDAEILTPQYRSNGELEIVPLP